MNAPVRFVGYPDGPKVFVKTLGQEVGTFTEPPGGKYPALQHHVPLSKRGLFRPEDLANYNPNREYRVDKLGYVLCYEKLKDGETICKRRAVNRMPKCNFHGGRLHPLDKLIEEDMELEDVGTQADSRYQRFLAGQLSADELDDEEIRNFGFRDEKTGRIYKPKKIDRALVNQFTRVLYDRALNSLQSHAVEAVKTLTTIMMDKDVDAPVRVKAATEILDRTLGKATQVVALTGTTPLEEIFEGIAAGSREESRRRRGEVVEGEVVTEPVAGIPESVTKPDSEETRDLWKELESGTTQQD